MNRRKDLPERGNVASPIIPAATVAANLNIDWASLTTAQQTAFTYLCTSASALITNETGCTFSSTTENIRIGADGRGEFLLLKNPIISVNSAVDIGSGMTLTVSPVPYTAGTYDIIYDGLDKLWGFYPWQIVDLNLTWGWTTVPDDIAYVLSEVVRRGYNNPYSAEKKRVGDVEIDYASIAAGNSPTSFTEGEQSVLNSYKTTEVSMQLGFRPDRIDPHDYAKTFWGWW